MYYLDYSQELNSKIILNIIILYVYLQNDKCLILSVERNSLQAIMSATFTGEEMASSDIETASGK